MRRNVGQSRLWNFGVEQVNSGSRSPTSLPPTSGEGGTREDLQMQCNSVPCMLYLPPAPASTLLPRGPG